MSNEAIQKWKCAAPAGPALSHHTHMHVQSIPDTRREIAQRLFFWRSQDLLELRLISVTACYIFPSKNNYWRMQMRNYTWQGKNTELYKMYMDGIAHIIWLQNNCMNFSMNICMNIFLVTLYYRDQFSLLTSCLLACLLLTYWLFISVYKAFILHDHILHP